MLHCSSGKPHILGSSSTGPQVHSSSTNNERKRTLIQTAMQMERRKKRRAVKHLLFRSFSPDASRFSPDMETEAVFHSMSVHMHWIYQLKSPYGNVSVSLELVDTITIF
jgi:hypothetical protein